MFWEGLTVREHVDIWRRIKVAGGDTSFEVNDVLTKCDILEKANATANNLSGGMQRKLQLAIASVGGSQLCFIDEASSGLVCSQSFTMEQKSMLIWCCLGSSLQTQYLEYHFSGNVSSHNPHDYSLPRRSRHPC